ncbi:MAG: elongator complex protein 3 [Sarcina sp.]
MGKKHYIIPIFVPHEGCPHDCAFCNQARITGEETEEIKGPKFKLENGVNAKFVKDTIEEYMKTIVREKNTTIEVSFFGGTFTAVDITKQKRLLSVAKEYKEKGVIDYIRLSTRPDYIDDDILTHLKSFSVDIIELGVQSLNEEVLFNATRGHTGDDVEKASKLIKKYGFILGHQIMLGLPSDTKERDIETTKRSISMEPEIARIYPALTIKDTAMEYMYNNNTYVPYSLDECVDIAKACYKLYIEAGVNVIRVGLQATDNIAEGEDIITGPFHPAFRELVEGNILNEEILNLIEANKLKDEIVINISNRSISKLYADKKRYFIDLKSKIDNNLIVNVIKDIDKSFIIIESSEKSYKIDII